MSLLGHVNRRLRSSPGVQLPMQSVFAKLIDPSTPASVKPFLLVYVEIGYARLDNEVGGRPQSSRFVHLTVWRLAKITTLFSVAQGFR